MKKKPGVFDPFRQEAVDPPPESIDPQDAALDLEDDATQKHACVMFMGDRVGMNVWVPLDVENTEREAREQLGELIHELNKNPVLRQYLVSAGIHTGVHENGVVIADEPYTFTILNTTTPTEKLASVLRTLENTYANVHGILATYGVRPFIRA